MSSLIPIERIASRIYLIRGEKVMLDEGLAELYGVPTKVLNQAVKRNRSRSVTGYQLHCDPSAFPLRLDSRHHLRGLHLREASHYPHLLRIE